MNNTNNPAPARLSAEAKRWWAALVVEYGIGDPGGRLLLATGLEAFDRMRQAQKAIAKDGAVVLDRFDRPKSHPSLVTERDSRAQLLMCIKHLNLDVEPLRDHPGRPGGS